LKPHLPAGGNAEAEAGVLNMVTPPDVYDPNFEPPEFSEEEPTPDADDDDSDEDGGDGSDGKGGQEGDDKPLSPDQMNKLNDLKDKIKKGNLSGKELDKSLKELGFSKKGIKDLKKKKEASKKVIFSAWKMVKKQKKGS
jgi:hypothetical protein